MKVKKLLLMALIGSLTLSMFHAPAAEAAPAKLGALEAEIKNLTVERIEQGSRITAIVRLSNKGTEMIRVPDYGVRAVTADNVSYTLQPSLDNPASVYPRETVDMHYMLAVRRTDAFVVSKLNWVQMNKSVYPRTETTVLSLAAAQNRMETRVWGRPFSLPSAPAHIVFTPVKLFQQAFLEGPNLLITFQVENKGSYRDFVPDFLVEGQTNRKWYEAEKIEGSKSALEPGEKSFIYYRIQLEGKEDLKNLNILTKESFVDASQKTIPYRVNWLWIPVPASLNEPMTMEQLPDYDRSIGIELDPDNRIIPQEVEIQLSKFTISPWTTAGLKTVTAEFTIINRGLTPLPKPEFEAELLSPEGRQYLGTLLPKEEPLFVFESEPDMDRTGAINPHVPYAVSYEFHLPVSDISRRVGIIISDGKSLQPFRIPIAAFQAAVQ